MARKNASLFIICILIFFPPYNERNNQRDERMSRPTLTGALECWSPFSTPNSQMAKVPPGSKRAVER